MLLKYDTSLNFQYQFIIYTVYIMLQDLQLIMNLCLIVLKLIVYLDKIAIIQINI